MRANIIIHSINGNIFLMAKALKEKIVERDIDARIYRIEDSDLHLAAAKDNQVNEYYEEIISLPLASNEKLRKGDAIILACPAIFSLPSAEMVTFLNQTLPLWEQRELEGKVFYAFSSSSISSEEGTSCITGLQLWADSMQMNIISSPVMVHADCEGVAIRPGEETILLAEEAAKKISEEL